MENESIMQELKKSLSEDRFRHSVSTAKMAAVYASWLGCDLEKAYTAGLAHDCAKYLSGEGYLKEAAARGIEIDEVQRNSPALLHGAVGAAYARELYGISDEESLSAICYHTTGRPAMAPLEKAVFLADLTEEGRDEQYTDVAGIRAMAAIDFDRAMVMAFDAVISDVLRKGGLLHKNTVNARNYILSKSATGV
jgi:predicted HD superfamily hydrolase involved in NAD metabolism